jgi:two-component system, OmpR family, response regulator
VTTPLRRILMVEDDPDIAELGQIALVDIGGFEVTICGSGDEALARVGEFKPDLVLLDYRLPGMNGDELLIALRERPETCELPVIFLTASVMPDRVDHLLGLGAVDLIAKPFDPMTLADQVQSIWAGLA